MANYSPPKWAWEKGQTRERNECSKVLKSKNSEISRFILPTPSSTITKAEWDILISMVLHRNGAPNTSKPVWIHELCLSLAYHRELMKVYFMDAVSD